VKSFGVLRELVVSCNLMSVYTILYHKHAASTHAFQKNSPSFDEYTTAYKNVIVQMMLKPIKKSKSAMPLYVSYQKEVFEGNDESYYSVSFLNLKYEEPPKDCKPWGGNNHPEGYYNCNLNKYNKFFAVVGNNWTQLINSTVMVDQSALDTNITNEQLIAEILWEITFYGYSEKKADQFVKNLNKRITKVKKSLSKNKTTDKIKLI
jgi:hypothetical protein